MSGLFGSLSSGVQAINAQAKALEVTTKNLANVNNPDFARQRVVFGDRGTVLTPQGPQSLGLEAIGVNSLRDRLLDSQVVREVSQSGGVTAEARALQQAQAILGERIDRTGEGSVRGLSGTLNDFFDALSGLASSPTDLGERQALLTQAGILTDRLNVTDRRLADLQTGLGTAVQTDMEAANGLLQTIATLNSQIGRLEIGRPGTAVDLRDQREAAIEKLAGYIAVETRAAADQPGQLDVFARAEDGSEVALVQLAIVTGRLEFDGASIRAGDPPVGLALSGGSIQGHLNARDGAIADLRGHLDQLAGQLVSSVNGIYGEDGGPAFFDPAGTTAGNIRLASGLTPATIRTSASGISGDNTIISRLADLARQTHSSSTGDRIDGTFMDFHAATVTALGNAVAGKEAQLEDQANIERLVRAQRDSMSAVSLDEEMVNLMKYQRSFEASARVVQIVDDLLDVIVNRMGRV